jgi:Putative beta-barrel porin-2, OmpL-like. bbp2
MRTFKHDGRLFQILFAALLCGSIFPNRLLADDKEAGNPPPRSAPAKSDAPKIEAPAPLSDRERWLLDRVELLEKRVEELEFKGRTAVAASAEAATPPTSVGVNTPVAGTVTTAGTVGQVTLGDSNAAPANAGVPAVAAQAAEKGKAAGTPKPQSSEPFAFADWSWLTGNARTKDTPYDTKFFTPEFRADINYVYDFNHPKDDTIGGSSEIFRSNEVHVTDIGVGGDFHYNNVRGRILSQIGLYSQTTARNDASPARGQWNLADAYRYVSEAYGGYHFNVLHGVNVDAGIFLSYVGLFSYYQFDNWAYQPSYVSSNTPWFFNGLRVQIYPTEKLKIEPWFINGWQSYGRFNNRPGLGMQIAWRPNGKIAIIANQYGLGEDTLATPGRMRLHTDDSIQVKYYDNEEKFFDKAAFSVTLDAGCETGGGVSCYGNRKGGPKQSFLGFMLYERMWFHKDLYGLTVGGGRINNPGRYLVLLPPINGATAASGTPYFTGNPGDPFKAWDISGTFDYMPSQYITFRWEYNHRAANVPYFSGPGGITPTSCPTSPTFLNICGSPGAVVPGFTPDLRKSEDRGTLAILVKF